MILAPYMEQCTILAPYMEQCINIMHYKVQQFATALQQSFHEYSLFKSITIKGVVMFRQCLPQHHRKIYEYSLGVMMCAKASREAVNENCTSPEAHHRHMHKLFCGNLVARVTRKTGKHLMTGKRRKNAGKHQIFCRKTLKKSSFIVLWYRYDVCNHIF